MVNEGYVCMDSEEEKKRPNWVHICRSLVVKNIWQLRHAKFRLLLILLSPAVAVLMFWAHFHVEISQYSQRVSDSSRQKDLVYTEKELAGIRMELSHNNSNQLGKCRWFDAYAHYARDPTNDCITLMYTITSMQSDKVVQIVNQVMQKLSKNNGFTFQPIYTKKALPSSFSQARDVHGASSIESLFSFARENDGRVSGMVIFDHDAILHKNLNISVFANNTLMHPKDIKKSRKHMIEREVITSFLAVVSGFEQFNITLQVKPFRHLYNSRQFDKLKKNKGYFIDIHKDSYAWAVRSCKDVLGIYITGAFLISSLLLLSFIFREKDEKLLGLLRSYGVSDSAYWLSWYFIYFVLLFFGSLLALMVSYAASILILSDSGFWPPFIVLLCGGISVLSSSTIVVVLAKQNRVFIGLGLVHLSSSFVVSYLTSSMKYQLPSNNAGIIFRIFFPSFHISKVLNSMGKYNALPFEAHLSLDNYSVSTMSQILGKCKIKNKVCVFEKDYGCSDNFNFKDCIALPNEKHGLIYPSQCAPPSCYFYPNSDLSNIFFLVCQSFFYVFLSWYLLQVLPCGNGIPKPVTFIFDKRYWSSRFKIFRNSPNEQQQSHNDGSIRICNISKRFRNNVVALDAISTVMEKGQIHVMLGHNSAGKTTLVNVLTGKVSTSSGDAFVSGLSVKYNATDIQYRIGVVPQHDIFWPELSGRQHLQLFASLKHQCVDEYDVKCMLNEVNLLDHAEECVASYSRGMKRRLSIAFAQIGNPTVVFLDEPTTGIDPLNRRRIWNLIQKLKQNRVVVLTTHMMEEAEFLGDKIAILHKGVIQAMGTPLQLKYNHGTGYYSVNVMIENRAQTAPLRQAMEQLLGEDLEAIFVSPKKMTFSVNINSKHKIPEVTRELEKCEVDRNKWTVSQSTLGEVYLRLTGHEAEEKHAEAIVVAEEATTSGMEDERKDSTFRTMEIRELSTYKKGTKKSICTHQVLALLKMQVRIEKRDFLATLIQFLIPLLLLLIAKVLGNYQPNVVKMDEKGNYSIDFQQMPSQPFFNSQGPIIYGRNSNIFESSSKKCISCDYNKVAWISGENDKFEIPKVNTVFLNRSVHVNHRVFENQKYVQKHARPIPSIKSKYDFSSCAVRDGQKLSDLKMNEVFLLTTDKLRVRPLSSDFCKVASSFNAKYSQLFPDFGIHINKRFATTEKLDLDLDIYQFSLLPQQLRGNILMQPYYYTIVQEGFCTNGSDDNCSKNGTVSCIGIGQGYGCQSYNEYLYFSRNLENIREYLIKFGFQIPFRFRNLSGGNFSSGSVFLRSNTVYGRGVDTNWFSIGTFAFAIPLLINFPIILTRIVTDKKDLVAILVQFHGLRIGNYWCFLFLVHFFVCFISYTSMIGLSYILSLPYTNDGFQVGYVIMIFFPYVYAQFGYLIFCSNIFKNARLAAILTSVFVLLLLLLTLLIQQDGDLILNFPWYMYITLFFPPIGFSHAIFLSIWGRHFDEIWRISGMLVISGTVFGCLGIFIHAKLGLGVVQVLGGNCQTKTERSRLENNQHGVVLDDVENEEKRALALEPHETAIKIEHLHKVFKSRNDDKVAVVDLCMAMEYGEVFGLLGPNGAGKTTVINMLVGQMEPTSGTAFICGIDSRRHRKELFNCIGVVPQFDVLYPNLTVSDHLELFGEIKGIPRAQLKAEIALVAQKVALYDDETFSAILSKDLSAGKRRRLSIAIAMLGDPDVLFLDEPTTGIDVEIKRQIWNIIENMKNNNKCIVLTTHTMDEAERLCSRVGIMARGELKCIGTQQNIRNRFEVRYQLTFSLSSSTSFQELSDFFTTRYPSFHFVSSYGDTNVCEIMKKEVPLMSELFELILEGQEHLRLYTEWEISHPSLEESFCAITAEFE